MATKLTPVHVVGIIVFGGIAALFAYGLFSGMFAKGMVIDDAIAQYRIVSRSGTPMDKCVHAGFVAAAMLQAEREESYAEWKAIEAKDCELAGLGR